MLRLRFAPRFLGALAGALLPFLAAGAASAETVRGTVAGSEMSGYGRLVFAFDREVAAEIRPAGSVLIVQFGEKVAIDLEKLAQQLPNYVSVARGDPDGRSIRFGMNAPFRADLKKAGERVYLDLLPARWQGLPPGLPPEVVQELVRRARDAEDQLRRAERERERHAPRDLDLRIGTAPTFRRAMFVMPRAVPVEHRETEGLHEITFDSAFRIEPETVRARLAGLARDIEVERGETFLRIRLRPADGLATRAFREDDSFTFDFTRADGSPIDQAAAPSEAPALAEKPAPAQPPASAPPAAAGAPAIPTPDARGVVKLESVPARPMLDASFEKGADPAGFALRLAHVGDVPVAIVQRRNALIILLETGENLSVPTVPAELKHNIEGIGIQRDKGATLIQVQPRGQGRFWLTRDGDALVIQRGRAEAAQETFAGRAIVFKRAFDTQGREGLEAEVPGGTLRFVEDPGSGGRLALVPVPRAGLASHKPQHFVEFSIEPTLAGLAVLPIDEAVTVTREAPKVRIGHDLRLNLSAMPPEANAPAKEKRAQILDPVQWMQDRRGSPRELERKFLLAAAESPRINRPEARLRLAKFYLANGFVPEAMGVLDVLAADDPAFANTKAVVFHRALAAALHGRGVDANRFLAEPSLGGEPEQRLLQAMVDAKGLRHTVALANFVASADEIDRYPEDLQVEFRRLAIQAATESGDLGFARTQLLAFENLDRRVRNPHLQQVLAGRLAEAQGRNGDAFNAYGLAIQSHDRRIEAEARFGRASAGLADGKMTPEEARNEFETLTAIWRRSEVELKSLDRLAEIYAGEGRWREAFLAGQRASAILPEHPITRALEDRMSRRFENLFLDDEADRVSKVEALAIYQEFRTLVPPGRRGDEIARRLAERLHELDLVREAAHILEHQVDNRLEGVARASVAARLAVIHLANREPAAALATLRKTRLSSLPTELRRARTLLEARALGELFRTDLAGEMLVDLEGEDVDRLRADIFWKGKKWREAGEAYERLLAEKWQGPAPLEPAERLDVMRAGLAYVLGDEQLAIDRLRGRYLPKMAKSEDAGAFNLITHDGMTKPQAFRDVARSVVNADTLTEFLAAYRKRYPETGGAIRPVRRAADPLGRQAGQPAAPAGG